MELRRGLVACLGLLTLSGHARTEEKHSGAALNVFQQAWYTENALRQLSDAITLYQEVAETARQSGDSSLGAKAYIRIGICYERLQKKPEAIEAYQKAWKLSPREEGASTEMIDKLEQAADKLIFLDELPLSLQNAICDHYYTQAEKFQSQFPEKAIEVYRRAVAVSKYLGQKERAAYAASFIGDLYRRLEMFEEALKSYHEVHEQFPKSRNVLAWNHNRIAETYRLLGRPEDAVASYRELEEPKFEKQVQARLWAKLWMGDTYLSMGKREQALLLWEGMASEEPNPRLPSLLASLLLGKAKREIPEEPEDSFSNDIAYFVAIRHRLTGDEDAYLADLQQCVKLSQGVDWPKQLAEMILKEARDEAE